MFSIAEYYNKGIIVDTNILLLLVVGAYRPKLIGTDRLSSFTQEDHDLLLNLLANFKTVVVTPHVLTEVNNLAFLMIAKPHRYDLQTAFRKIIESEYLREEHLPATEIAGRRAFLPFGLTDASISAICQQSYLVLTDDGALSAFLSDEKIDVINFNYLRSYA